MCKNCFSKLHQFSSIRSDHGTIEWRLHITTSGTRNEPSCMSNNPSHQGAVGGWTVINVCALALPPTLYAPVLAVVSDSFQLLRCSDVTVWEELRMTVRPDRLDLTLSAPLDERWLRISLQNDVRESKEVQHFSLPTLLRTCLLGFSFLQLWTCRTRMFSLSRPFEPVTSFNVGQSHCIIGSSLSSMMRSVRLCGSACVLPLTHDVHPWLK